MESMQPKTAPRVLLVSCYELGRQPLALATAQAFLMRAGAEVRSLDAAVETLDDAAFRDAEVVAISVPMLTALRLGLNVAGRARTVNPAARIAFYGLYAALNQEHLLDWGAHAVFAGELEETLARWVLADGATGAYHRPLERLDFPPPARDGLPSLDNYARLDNGAAPPLEAGAVEATRGCRHLCRHCPIPPVYEGRFFVVPLETVLADIDGLVARGARHISFADPDFLNGPRHALEVVRGLNRAHPEVTFDFTAKVEHLIRRRRFVEPMAELGCLFVVSAVESLSNRVLRELDKGHTRDDVFESLALLRSLGITLRPTLVPFTPWTTRDDYLDILEWVAREGLVEAIDSVQFSIRLLIPPGSLLLDRPSLASCLGALDREGFTYRWRHPDPGMDTLQRDIEDIVEVGVRQERSARELFDAIRAKAFREAHGRRPLPLSHVSESTMSPPRLTENWFC